MSKHPLLIVALVAILSIIASVALLTDSSVYASFLMTVSLLFGAGVVAIGTLGIMSAWRSDGHTQPLAHDITPDGFVRRSEVIDLCNYRQNSGKVSV